MPDTIDCTDPAALARAAACFCYQERVGIAVELYLLAQLAGGSMDPATIAREAAAAGFGGIQNRENLDALRTYLLCNWSNVSGEGCDHPIVLDWLQRLANDYQPMPSQATISAVCDFCEALDIAGITDKMLVVNPIIPDSFLAMRYPLIWQPTNGVSPFINHNFVAADLDVNGLVGDGATKFFDTGFFPDAYWASTDDGGQSIYQSEDRLGIGNEIEVGCISSLNSSTQQLGVFFNALLDLDAECWEIGISSINSVLGAETPAFYSANRTSLNLFSAYQGNSLIPFNLLGTNIADQTGVILPELEEYIMATNDDGASNNHSSKRVSFMAIHEGLTQGEAEDLFWAVQFLRMALGGGAV